VADGCPLAGRAAGGAPAVCHGAAAVLDEAAAPAAWTEVRAGAAGDWVDRPDAEAMADGAPGDDAEEAVGATPRLPHGWAADGCDCAARSWADGRGGADGADWALGRDGLGTEPP